MSVNAARKIIGLMLALTLPLPFYFVFIMGLWPFAQILLFITASFWSFSPRGDPPVVTNPYGLMAMVVLLLVYTVPYVLLLRGLSSLVVKYVVRGSPSDRRRRLAIVVIVLAVLGVLPICAETPDLESVEWMSPLGVYYRQVKVWLMPR